MEPDDLTPKTRRSKLVRDAMNRAREAGYAIAHINGLFWAMFPAGPSHWSALTGTKRIELLHDAALDAIKRQKGEK